MNENKLENKILYIVIFVLLSVIFILIISINIKLNNFNIFKDSFEKLLTFFGSLAGTLISGLVAISVYKGNIRNTKKKEKSNEISDNYKEFKILEDAMYRTTTNMKFIAEEMKKSQIDSRRIMTCCINIRETKILVNMIDPKLFTIEEGIFQNSRMLIQNYFFIYERCEDILRLSSNDNYEINNLSVFVVGFEDIRKIIEDTYYDIRRSYVELKYKV